MKIRNYEAGDAVALARLYVASVGQIGARHYSARQVAAWVSLAPSPERLHELSTDGRARLVAIDPAGRPMAFADLEQDGHIHFLYCAPEAAGSGIAAALYGELEGTARARGMFRLYAEASEAAQRFFVRQGFAVTAKRKFEISGVPIHNYAVEKFLANS